MAQEERRHRDQVPTEDQWDLAPLFGSDDQWETLFETIAGKIEGYADHRGRIGQSAETLSAAITFDLEISRTLDRLYTYAHLRYDQDQGHQGYLGMHQRAVSLYTRASELSSFMRPAIMAIPEAVMDGYLAEDCLAPFRFHLEQLLRFRNHTLSESEETLLAMSREMAQTPGQVFRQLDNVDMDFGSIRDQSGNTVALSHGNFTTLLQSSDRTLRKAVFHQYYDAYHRHRNTIAAALTGAVKGDLFYARSRRHPSCRSAALHPDNMPEAVYDNLVDTVRKGLPVLFRYLDFRKRAMALDTLHIYDTYVPIVQDVPFRLSYEEAVETCLAALAPWGAAYTDTLGKGLLGGWVDRYENRGKRSGAYSSGCYDSAPYILLNYEPDTINSLYTLVHEAGHSMHSHYSKSRQPYVTHGYTIFVAEVASTFNEILLSRYLLDQHRDDPKMTAYILNREVDNIRATLFRQTMFAEFEHRTHLKAEASEPITLESLTDDYRQLLNIYFGDHLSIDEPLALECLRIPHFYSAFYVYKYATGISAAIALARKVMDGADADRDAYLNFLSLGGSRYPLDALVEAGVDMGSPEPVRSAIRHFDEQVGRLERVWETLDR
jgi:oligoendopeptidase F